MNSEPSRKNDQFVARDIALWIGDHTTVAVSNAIARDLQQPQSRVAAHFNWLCDPCKHGREDEDPLIEEFIRLASRRGAGNLVGPEVGQPRLASEKRIAIRLYPRSRRSFPKSPKERLRFAASILFLLALSSGIVIALAIVLKKEAIVAKHDQPPPTKPLEKPPAGELITKKQMHPPASTPKPDPQDAPSMLVQKPESPKTDKPSAPDDQSKELLARLTEVEKDYPSDHPLPVKAPGIKELRDELVEHQKNFPDATSPAMTAFIKRAEATPEHEVAYAAYRAKELSGKPRDNKDVRELCADVLALPYAELVAGNDALMAFMRQQAANDPEIASKVLRLELVGLTQAAREVFKPARGPYLFSLLPQNLRDRALAVYNEARLLGLKNPELLDAGLENFLMRSRRPQASDAVGIVVPTHDVNHFFLNHVIPERNPIGEANWRRLIEAGNQYVPIIAVVNLVMDRAALAQLGQTPVRDPKYYELITQAKLANVRLTGLVDCSNGTKRLQNIGNEIDLWFGLYDNLSGIFLYNAPSGQDGSKYVAEIYNYIMMNYGNVIVVSSSNGLPAEDLVKNTGSNLITCTSAGGMAAAFKPPAWSVKYDPVRFGAWLQGSPDTASIELATEKHLGWVYVGGVQGPLPELSGAESPLIVELAKMNAKIMGGKVTVGAGGKTSKTSKKAKSKR